MTRALIYLRVSTEDQRTGLGVQRDACRRWADAQGLPVADEYVDHGVGGGTPPEKRGALMDALGALERGDVLLVHKRDRLARGVMVAGMIESLAAKAGAAVRCADGTGNGDSPEDGLLRSIVDAFAEYERMLIKFRTAAALARKKSRRQKYSGVSAYGWESYPTGAMRPDGTEQHGIRENETEQRAVVLVHDMRKDGATYAAICERLTAQGHAPRGAKWHANSVRRILAFVPPAARPACGATNPRT